MAYVEEMHLRQNSRDDKCIDSIQFGQDDRVPFVTLMKSDQFCGERYGKQRYFLFDATQVYMNQ